MRIYLKKVHLICAARPNFIKINPLYHELKKSDKIRTEIVHTGQHYDFNMSQIFFDDFKLPKPDFYLGVKGGNRENQIVKTKDAYKDICYIDRPDFVVVVGDVNPTVACAKAAWELGIKVGHLEAGLRSFDKSMPEELNRIETAYHADFHWAPSPDAVQNLVKEGVNPYKISNVGNIMVDSYFMSKKEIEKRDVHTRYGFKKKEYAILTLHRPFNVDNGESLSKIFSVLKKINCKVLFPVHPRTKKELRKCIPLPDNIVVSDPMGYLDFMSFLTHAQFVITDSGGIQEETTFLKIPCFTLRNSTERPITVIEGTNQLVTVDNLFSSLRHPKMGRAPKFWDGKTARRVCNIITRQLGV